MGAAQERRNDESRRGASERKTAQITHFPPQWPAIKSEAKEAEPAKAARTNLCYGKKEAVNHPAANMIEDVG